MHPVVPILFAIAFWLGQRHIASALTLHHVPCLAEFGYGELDGPAEGFRKLTEVKREITGISGIGMDFTYLGPEAFTRF